MSKSDLWYHMVWTTKHCEKIISISDFSRVVQIILQSSYFYGIHIDRIDGYQDHFHCLIKLSRTMSVAECAKLLKGMSSKMINDLKFMAEEFQWQDGYYVNTVSLDNLERVRNYIANQKTHHGQPGV